MRTINKQQEPPELLQYRKKPDATYEDAPKEPLQEALLKEQGFLCAYCMQRIDMPVTGVHANTKIRIEHWQSKSEYPNLALIWTNLLGVCQGNERNKSQNQTCDVRKGNQTLSKNPANAEHRVEETIRYLGNGEIKSQDANFDSELKQRLNLNESMLLKNRKAVFDEVIEALTTAKNRARRRIRDKFSNRQDGRYTPFYGVAIYLIDRVLPEG